MENALSNIEFQSSEKLVEKPPATAALAPALGGSQRQAAPVGAQQSSSKRVADVGQAQKTSVPAEFESVEGAQDIANNEEQFGEAHSLGQEDAARQMQVNQSRPGLAGSQRQVSQREQLADASPQKNSVAKGSERLLNPSQKDLTQLAGEGQPAALSSKQISNQQIRVEENYLPPKQSPADADAPESKRSIGQPSSSVRNEPLAQQSNKELPPKLSSSQQNLLTEQDH